MIKDTLLEEVNLLWEAIRPYLVKQVEELYRGQDGHILEIGPFSGLIFALAQKNVGQTFSIAAFPQASVRLCQQEAQKLGLEDRVRIIESDSSLTGVLDRSVDFAIFRGALFFPSLFKVDFRAIYRKLRNGGIAFVVEGSGNIRPPKSSAESGSVRRNSTLNWAG